MAYVIFNSKDGTFYSNYYKNNDLKHAKIYCTKQGLGTALRYLNNYWEQIHRDGLKPWIALEVEIVVKEEDMNYIRICKL